MAKGSDSYCSQTFKLPEFISQEELDAVVKPLPNPLQKAFLQAYARLGSISGAAKAVKMSAANHYRWNEQDLDYSAAFAFCRELAGDSLEMEARRRAFGGSDILLIFLLKGLKPEKYRENLKVDYGNLSDKELDQRIVELARKSGLSLSSGGEGGSQDGTYRND